MAPPGRPPRARPGSGGSGPWALTGTPGTGKSTVARILATRMRVVEVGAWALATGLGTQVGESVTVDLPSLRRRFRGLDRRDPHDLYVGHLAHLLPIRRTIILRCHPVELARRLAQSGHGSARERAENVAVEALDVVTVEARELGRRVREVDTTGRSPASVAREVWALTQGRAPQRPVRWLEDPTVTDYLLETSP